MIRASARNVCSFNRKYVVRSFSNNTPGPPRDSDSIPIDQAELDSRVIEDPRGAMKSYMKKVSESQAKSSGETVWAKLRKDLLKKFTNESTNAANSTQNSPEPSVGTRTGRKVYQFTGSKMTEASTPEQSSNTEAQTSATGRKIYRFASANNSFSITTDASPSSSDTRTRIYKFSKTTNVPNKFKKRVGKDKSDNIKGFSDGGMTDAMRAVLVDDMDYFKTLAYTGHYIDTTELRGLGKKNHQVFTHVYDRPFNLFDLVPDSLVASVLVEAYKTEEGGVTGIVKMDNFDKTQIPAPRSMIELVRSLQPDVHSIQESSPAYPIAVDAWKVNILL